MAEKAYKIKTKSGFFYTDGNGRYGRVDGTVRYEALCQEHANEVTALFDKLEVESEIIEIKAAPFVIPCAKCKRDEEKQR